MNTIFSAIMTYNFLSRALVVGLMISLCAALLGVVLVLKRYSMIGDGLSHISFGALAFAAVMGYAPLKVAIPVVAVAAVLLLRLGGKKIKGDSLIAIISAGALAIGITLISYSGSSADMNSYLIGSLYAVKSSDMTLAIVLCSVVLAVFVLMYNRIFATTFDEDFSKATGVKPGMYNTVIAVLTAVTVVIGMRLMGSLLISALIVFPALSSMRIFKSFFAVTLSSVVISVVSFITGFCLTIILDGIPTGACITLVNLLIFVLFSLVEQARK
ncbi:MAG: metal ABC transporter permease [Clostridia bacterium]|nr:metal ABC transporter permease [Clostridia bacterium]